MKNSFEQLMQQAKSFQENVKKAQAEIKSIQVTGEAGAGMVKVVMDGQYQMQQIDIDDEVFQEDKTVLKSLLMAASNAAAEKVKNAVEEKMRQCTAHMGLPSDFNLPWMS